jgi:uncharacterized protein (DUF983 family)
MADTVQSRGGPSTLSLLGVAFVVLKLVGVIDWSWWWVTLPFWGPVAFIVGGLLLGLVTYVVGGAALDTRRARKRRKTLARRRNGTL